MTIFERFFANLTKRGLEYFRRYYGIYYGICESNEDPEENGRVLVRVPLVTGLETHPVWAMPIAPWAGKNCGFFCVPDVKDPVWVCFENGSKDAPQWIGGWWPRVESDNFVGDMSPYTNGKPTKRIFKTKAGHELSFEDDQSNLSCKFVWHDPEKDIHTFVAFTPDGSIQIANHKGCIMEMRAKDGDELVMIMDKNRNTIIQDKDGTKIVDFNGNAIEMKKDLVQIIGTKGVVVNSQSVNLKTGGVEIGDIATDSTIKGTSFMTWWKTTFLIWLNTHTHGTPVGPSTPPLSPSQAPVDQQVITDRLKVQ